MGTQHPRSLLKSSSRPTIWARQHLNLMSAAPEIPVQTRPKLQNFDPPQPAHGWSVCNQALAVHSPPPKPCYKSSPLGLVTRLTGFQPDLSTSRG